jgi:hypothetical protein
MANRFVNTMNDLINLKPVDYKRAETLIESLRDLEKALKVISIINKNYPNINVFLKEYKTQMKTVIQDEKILNNLAKITVTIKNSRKGDYYNISELEKLLLKLEIISKKDNAKQLFEKFKKSKYYDIALRFMQKYTNDIAYFESDGNLYIHKTLFIDFLHFVNSDLMLHIVRPYLLQLD